MGSDPKAVSVSMARIGETLREAREKKSLTIDQAQKQTRIHITVLQALEDGKCDTVLTPIYVKSFLKKYAEYLGLDSRQMVGEYAKLRPAASAQLQGKSAVGTPSAQPSQISIKSKVETAPSVDLSKYFPAIKRIAVAAIILAVAMFVWGKTAAILKHSKKAPATAAAKSARPMPSPVKKKASAAVKKEPQSKTVAGAPSAQPQSKTAAGAPSVQPSAKIPAVSVSSPIPKTVPLKLLISVNQTVMVKVKTDGNLLFSHVLTRGSVESFAAKDRFNIYTAKGEAIELFLNGKSLGSPGKGIMKDIEVTRSGIKIR